MSEQENKKQRLSNRMKRTHKYASIMSKLILTQINGEWIFKLDSLSQEEKDYISKEWCNAF